MPTTRVAASLNNEFARWFTDRRKDKGSQENVADMIGVARITLARWENGVMLPSAKYIPFIAKAFILSDTEVAKRAGVVLDSHVSAYSLSLAELIESKTTGFTDAQLQSLTRGIDGLLTAFASVSTCCA
jgi:transcriptional regulator with XRE-family HTH domain